MNWVQTHGDQRLARFVVRLPRAALDRDELARDPLERDARANCGRAFWRFSRS